MSQGPSAADTPTSTSTGTTSAGPKSRSDLTGPKRMFKSSRDMTLPEGYLPVAFTACVLTGAPPGGYGGATYTDAEKAVFRDIVEKALPLAKLTAAEQGRISQAIYRWLNWDPYIEPRPALSAAGDGVPGRLSSSLGIRMAKNERHTNTSATASITTPTTAV